MPETEGPTPDINPSTPENPSKQPSKRKGLNPIIARIQNIVNEDKPRTSSQLGYESTVGIYGGKLVTDDAGKTVYDTTGVVSKIDRFGDPRLREIDDHIGKKNRWQVLRHHPKWFWKHYFPIHALKTPETKRYRGNRDEMMANVEKLGLEDYYGKHPNGIEIRKPEIYSEGINLQDIWRADQIHSPLLDRIDRFQALKQASQYIRQVHDNHGGIGELVSSDVIFQEHSPEGTIGNPVLNLPDIVYNPRKSFGRQEQRATDMLDFMVGISTEELRRSGDWEQVQKVLDTIKDGYGPEDPNDSVFKWTGLLARRGRLTLEEHGLSRIHNFPRLGLTRGISVQLRQNIIDTCLSDNKSLTQA